MNRIKKIAVTGFAGAAIVVTGMGAAFGITEKYIDGGHWQYGVDDVKNFSWYDHNDRCHSSSVKNSKGIVQSGPTEPGKRAVAEMNKARWGNEAYFDAFVC